MNDEFYPTVDFAFIDASIRDCDKFLDTIEAGESIAYVLKGDKPIGKRTYILQKDSQINYMQSSRIAYECRFLDELMTWFEQKKNWKSGGYVESSQADKGK